MENEFLSSHEVADIFGVSARTLNRWHRLRKGPPRIKIGRRCLYRQTAVRDWLHAHESQCHA